MLIFSQIVKNYGLNKSSYIDFFDMNNGFWSNKIITAYMSKYLNKMLTEA